MSLKAWKIKLKTYDLFCIFLVLFFLKFCSFVFVFFYGQFFVGGDSDYYNSYALGEIHVATSIWPVILKFLNDFGLYSREGVRLILEILDAIFIPFLVARLTYVRDSPIRSKFFWGAIVFISAYPTLTYYATNIYRDVFMVFLWLLGLLILKLLADKQTSLKKFFLFISGFVIAYILYKFRNYLGFGYLLALILSKFYSFKRFPFLLFLLLFCVGLFGLFKYGFLDSILLYRSTFNNVHIGGTNLGIEFSSAGAFFPDLIKTTLYQLFGFFFVNKPSVLVFIFESVPFIFFLLYLVINRRYSNKFVDSLVIFFFSYSTVWLLGNDNLGTAVRLRVFSYIAIFISFCIVYQRKYISLKIKREV